MDPDSIQTVLWMLLLLIASAFFTAVDAAFTGCNRGRLKNMADLGDPRADRALRLAERLDRQPAALLVGDVLVDALFAQLAVGLFTDLYGAGRGLLIAAVMAVVAILLFGEAAPRGLAHMHAERFAMFITPFLRGVLVILYPLGWIFSLWTRLLQALFKPSDTQAVTEEDLLTIVDEAEQDGSLDEQESDLLRRVIAFDDREAEDILIPRVDVIGLSDEATVEEMATVFAETGFSRLPVYKETMDTILGVVHYKDFMQRSETVTNPTDIMKPPLFIPPTAKIRLLLKRLQEAQSHIAIVSDEYGGTLGIVTMEDILEELVGDIWDEHDDVIESIRPTEDGSFLVLCSTELTEVMDYFDCETACEAATVSGWVMEALECIPSEGDTFTADGLQGTVVKADAAHPEEVLLRPVEKPETATTDENE